MSDESTRPQESVWIKPKHTPLMILSDLVRLHFSGVISIQLWVPLDMSEHIWLQRSANLVTVSNLCFISIPLNRAILSVLPYWEKENLNTSWFVLWLEMAFTTFGFGCFSCYCLCYGCFFLKAGAVFVELCFDHFLRSLWKRTTNWNLLVTPVSYKHYSHNYKHNSDCIKALLPTLLSDNPGIVTDVGVVNIYGIFCILTTSRYAGF